MEHGLRSYCGMVRYHTGLSIKMCILGYKSVAFRRHHNCIRIGAVRRCHPALPNDNSSLIFETLRWHYLSKACQRRGLLKIGDSLKNNQIFWFNAKKNIFDNSTNSTKPFGMKTLLLTFNLGLENESKKNYHIWNLLS